MSYTWDQVVAWLGVVIPLGGIAWSGFQYVSIQREQQRQRRFENFFATIMRVHNADKALISQKAAIFELRNYPEYKDLILRICESPENFFPNPPSALELEFRETAKHFGGS